MKLSAMGGVLPQLIAGGGKNAGFGLGIVPGLLYKDYYKNKEEEEEAEKAAAGMKRGGAVSSPARKKTLAKTGFYDKGTTQAERQKIVSKVTTKPQRVAMVEKLLSSKKMKSGGSVSARADGCAVKGKTKGRFV